MSSLEKISNVGNFQVQSFAIQGPLLISPKILGDARGFFTERFRTAEFKEMGLPNYIQENYSRSQVNVLRGLHYQYDPPQGKLVTATRGKILDVIVDIRHKSPTYGQHLKVELSGDLAQWFWVPAGFAHGFCVLSQEGADVMYKVDNLYNAAGEGAILWNDPELGIQWPVREPLLSGKDQASPTFADYRKKPIL